MYVYKNKLYKKYRTAYSMHMHITCMHTYIHTYMYIPGNMKNKYEISFNKKLSLEQRFLLSSLQYYRIFVFFHEMAGCARILI